MTSSKLSGLLAVLLAFASVPVHAGTDDAAIASAARSAKPLSAAEVYAIYNNRTWIWKDGAAHFAVKKREFTAWTGEGEAAAYGEGRWFLKEPGQICFRATWYSRNKAKVSYSCFELREKESRIYQHKVPDGKWYIFKDSPQGKYDEITRVKAGNHVQAELDRNRRTVEQLSGGKKPAARFEFTFEQLFGKPLFK